MSTHAATCACPPCFAEHVERWKSTDTRVVVQQLVGRGGSGPRHAEEAQKAATADWVATAPNPQQIWPSFDRMGAAMARAIDLVRTESDEALSQERESHQGALLRERRLAQRLAESNEALAKARDDVALLADRIKELEAALEEIATHNRDMHGYCGTISAVMERLHPKEAHR